jgi:hypothetical protein
MKYYPLTLLVLFLSFILIPHEVSAGIDGVWSTSSSANGRNSGVDWDTTAIETRVSQFLEETLIRSMVTSMGEVIERMARQSGVGLMPDFILLAAQQGAAQCFRQESIMEMVREIYRDARTTAVQQLRAGQHPQRVIDEMINGVENDVGLLARIPEYQRIVQIVVQHVYEQQQKMVAMNMAQQYMRELEQQQENLRLDLKKHYQEGMTGI